MRAATTLPPPTPLPAAPLPRDALLRQHAELAEQERALDRRGQVRTRKVVIGPGKHSSAANTLDLVPCQLAPGDLELNRPATGRILLVRVVALPVRTAAVQLVVEDPAGRAAPLSIYHVPPRFEQKELEELWPLGAVFGVKEPLLRTLRSGHHIRVDSPADLVRLFPSSPLLRGISFPRSPSHPLDGKSCAALKDAGNAAFKLGRWIRAKEAYDWALAVAAGSDTDEQRMLRATVLSNLALVHLKLSSPDAARRAAQEGLDLHQPTPHVDGRPLSLDPLRAKLVYRLALALYALETYPATLEALAPLLALSPPDPLAAALASRARDRAVEAAHGPSPATLAALFRAGHGAGADMDAELDLADFLSPLIGIRPVPNRGRALVALAPIPRGTLLASLKPLVAAGGRADARGRRAFCAGVNLSTRTLDPWAVGACVGEVHWRAAEGGGADERAREAMRELWAGEELGRGGAGVEGDPSRAEGAVTFNAFHVEDLASSLPGAARPAPATATAEEEQEGFHARTALYPPAASALNHSCLPTASYTFLRGVFRLRARVDLAPGDELTDSYVDAMDPLEAREGKLNPHGFVCVCGLCEEERAVGAETRAERARLARELEDDAGSDDAQGEVDRVRRVKCDMERTHSPSSSLPAGGGGSLVRPALYAPARLLAQRLATLPAPTNAQRREAVQCEVEALTALGAVLVDVEGDGERWERPKLVSPPLVGDTNAVLSALFVARVWRELGSEVGTRHWIALASEIEAGQAGVELFALRYGDFARRQGLNLDAEGRRWV